MSWIKKIPISLMFLVISVFLGAILFEIALRLVTPEKNWGKLTGANILRDFDYEYDTSHIYTSENTVVKYVRNEFGLRDDCKDTKDIVVLSIGGSTTDQRYVPFEDTYQSVLQKKLKQFDNKFGCVSNAGVDGHSTLGHIFAFEEWFPLIPNLNPKFILLYVGINDAGFNSINAGYDTTIGVKGFLKEFETVRQLMPLYKFYKQKVNGSKCIQCGHKPKSYTNEDYSETQLNAETENLSNINADIFRSRIKELLHNIKNMDATPICVTQPHRYVKEKNGQIFGVKRSSDFSGVDYDFSIKKLNAVLMELCGENTLDLHNFKFSDDDFYDGVHTTAKGSRKVGEAMYDFFLTRFY